VAPETGAHPHTIAARGNSSNKQGIKNFD